MAKTRSQIVHSIYPRDARPRLNRGKYGLDLAVTAMEKVLKTVPKPE